jgi:acylphosphatase
MATADAPIRRRVRITGRVQGVGFRETCRREAQRLGVAGRVRNLGDGSVEATFEGPRSAIEQMIAWCRRGPRAASVRDVTVVTESPIGESGFAITS